LTPKIKIKVAYVWYETVVLLIIHIQRGSPQTNMCNRRQIRRGTTSEKNQRDQKSSCLK